MGPDIEILKDFPEAYARNPTAIGRMNCNAAVAPGLCSTR
jgi:hypothetical protein